jgi:hypothetical protein
MFEIGMRYSFTMKDIVEEDTAYYVRGRVVEYNHPLVKVEEIGDEPKTTIINCACSQFVSATFC